MGLEENSYEHLRAEVLSIKHCEHIAQILDDSLVDIMILNENRVTLLALKFLIKVLSSGMLLSNWIAAFI